MVRTGRRPDTDAVLSRLKGFQKATVEYAFERLYTVSDSSRRFLVADEVGLGKTLVARGLIAKAINHMWETVDRIDVVYICSNGNIARQNINRLRVDDGRDFQTADRLTMLPTSVKDLNRNKVNYLAFTPGTSFDLKSSLGRGEERVLLYHLMQKVWHRSDIAPINFFQGWVGRDRFRQMVKDFDEKEIDRGLARKFETLIKERGRSEKAGGKDLERRYNDLCDKFARTRKHIPDQQVSDRNQLIGELRSALALTCVKALEPDIVVLDEFQRFKSLLDPKIGGEASFLANELFTYTDEHTEVRLLLLSATPYKMYTLHHEIQDDDHYQDFLRTVEFLDPKLGEGGRFRNLIDQHRRNLYRIADEEDTSALEGSKAAIERDLRRVMSRTERVRVGDSGDGMVRELTPANIQLEAREVKACVALQRVGDLVDQPQVIEYWKSSPYLLNFMDNYKLKQEVMEKAMKRLAGAEVREHLASAPGLFLSWDEIEDYSGIDAANARLRSLLSDQEARNAWQLLWAPPSLPYYRMREDFEQAAAADFTKRLLFSSWAVVPKTVASLLSYETERRTIKAADPAAVNTPEERKNRKPLLKFAFSQERLTGMPVLGILYPSPTLAMIGDPLELQSRMRRPGDLLTLESILKQIKGSLQVSLDRLVKRLAHEGREDERWYWAAPLLLDQRLDEERTLAWFAQPDLPKQWAGLEKDDDDESRWHEHVERARELLAGELELGPPPDDLEEVIALTALAGPAVCALRALTRQSRDHSVIYELQARNAAARAAWGFRSLLNVPEVMSLLRGQEDDDIPYWRRVLDYSATGCLQSVLDEYCHVLYDLEGLAGRTPIEACDGLAWALFHALTLRTASLRIDDIRSVNGGQKIEVQDRRFRTHFAIRFGRQESEDGKSGAREEQVRTAFNSPFWPHVLATTSVGQEGLDFHAYCHAVIHWNLPSNPVDLEQREGRVHRFKGHAIRKNVAREFGPEALADPQGDVWKRVFELAEENTTDSNGGLVPFWVYPIEGGSYIERHVPRLPLSRDDYQLEALRRSVAVYRMVFGQPRQEDLLAYLLERIPEERLEALRPLLQIDLSPPSHSD